MPKNRKKCPDSTLTNLLSRKDLTVYFIGIGGSSMNALARLSRDLGYSVLGSDLTASDNTAALAYLGIRVIIGHDTAAVALADLVVYSHAIPDTDPELTAADEQGTVTVTRAEYMGALMLRYSRRIGISGTHGKSTVTALTEAIFTAAGDRPTALSGASLSTVKDSYLAGDTKLLVYEACEYRDSYHSFSPTVAVALNLELDHTDYFENIEVLKASFSTALSRADGFAVINDDDGNLAAVADSLTVPTVRFGSRHTADYQYLITAFLDPGYRFSVICRGRSLGEFSTPMRGVFNLSNVTAAIAVTAELGVDTDVIRRTVADFRGISRRLEHIGYYHGRDVFYDYAHHPTAVAASINALRDSSPDGITLIFRPHTYSRTAHLWEDFRAALSLADRIILTDIYPARENPVAGVSSPRLAAAIGSRAVYAPVDRVTEYLDHTRGTIIIMGAGELDGVKKKIINKG